MRKKEKKVPVAKPATGKKAKKEKRVKPPKKNKNVSQTIPNGQLIISNDKYFYGTDGKSTKTRMGTVVDSNRRDELAIVKYTTSSKHGTGFSNKVGFKGFGDNIFTLDNEGKPIRVDNKKFIQGNKKRNITSTQANNIKKANIKESRYRSRNRKNLKRLKGRQKKK